VMSARGMLGSATAFKNMLGGKFSCGYLVGFEKPDRQEGYLLKSCH
jgi:hypothetical protein